MKQWIKIGVIFLFGLFLAVPVQAKVEAKNGKFWFNGERQEMVWGRSCFKLANQITYHYTGQGGEHYGLGSARRFVDFHMETLGVPKGFVCRVFLETAAWSPCETGNQVNDGKPDSCMFGSEPRDMGFWNNSSWNAEKGESNRNQLRDGGCQKRQSQKDHGSSPLAHRRHSGDSPIRPHGQNSGWHAGKTLGPGPPQTKIRGDSETHRASQDTNDSARLK